MSQFYYLIASLPALRFEDREAMEPSEFLELAAEHVSDDDLSQIRKATLDAPEEGEARQPAVQRWLNFERGLRNALVRVRAQRAGTEIARYQRSAPDGSGGDESIELSDLAREAMSHESPLSGEEMINRARFSHAEEIAVGHFFDLDVLVSYYVMLQVLARKRTFHRRPGEEAFAAITKRITNEYYENEENRL